MNDRLFAVVPAPSHVDVFGLDDDGVFSRLARASSWSQARAIFGTLPGYRRHIALVAAGSQPPRPFLLAMRPILDRLVLVPDPWLVGTASHRTRLRARRSIRLALAHLSQPIETQYVFSDDDGPF